MNSANVSLPTPSAPRENAYHQTPEGIWTPDCPIVHRDEEYDPASFDLLLQMQERHFWYRGRHRFLLAALQHWLRRHAASQTFRHAIDLGGGCGGWVRYLRHRTPDLFAELALADSSRQALTLARPLVGEQTPRFQIDLLNLGWSDRWDVAFALDVLEHLPEDEAALRQIGHALTPGGLCFVTVPALQFFWSYNDEIVGHLRRYRRSDLMRLAQRTGLELLDARYFQFFLSPLVWLSRMRRIGVADRSPERVRTILARTHRVPIAPINGLLSLIFGSETPLGLWLGFPWGTSVLGVFAKPGTRTLHGQ